MLITSIIIYLAVTIAIGLWAARRVHSSKDYLIAGRSLPLSINMATVFATWFGAETVLSVSATFAKDGLSGVPADPFGASACLILAAVFFARAFYRMNLVTLGDFYRKRYDSRIEVVTSIAIVVSYLGWTSAQLTALGLVIWVISGGALTLTQGILIGAAIVLVYTIFGGMWSVALTDMVQAVVIVIGLFIVAYFVGDLAGGASKVIAQAHADGKLQLFPSGGTKEWLAFIAGFLTIALGSIPQQDVFQRMTSAKDEDTAVRGTVFGAIIYFAMAFVPMFIAYAALMIQPNLKDLFASDDARVIQRILPDIILAQTPLAIQVLFFGALLSAILSTAAGALLAPTALFANNVVKPFVPGMSDERLLMLTRICLVVFTAAALVFAVNSELTMYQMIQNAYKVTLAGAFVPLVFGIYWKKATNAGAAASIFFGLLTWGLAEFVGSETIPPQLFGLLAGLVAMVVVSLATQKTSQAPRHA
ncbi:MAG: sodium:solute symporter family protein [Casimicrobiaceae bacterium]|nr:sodium:solute symporter family protein [Casimicrobiaceae bacterium]MCX8099363.1 sodium:solute symporter family protein [Casimicrobiaceae bacterium]MDW8311977.1 sodium:solute symporter family protein [Burkholderiales bacterium]